MFRWNGVVTEFLHEEKLTGLQIHNVVTGEYEKIEADGVFVSIGRKPASELYHGQIKLDENGFFVNKKVIARYKTEFIEVEPTEVDLMDACPQMAVSVASCRSFHCCCICLLGCS